MSGRPLPVPPGTSSPQLFPAASPLNSARSPRTSNRPLPRQPGALPSSNSDPLFVPPHQALQHTVSTSPTSTPIVSTVPSISTVPSTPPSSLSLPSSPATPHGTTTSVPLTTPSRTAPFTHPSPKRDPRRLSGPPLPSSPVPTTPPASPRPSSSVPSSPVISDANACHVCKKECDKASESTIQLDNRVFHRECFRCMHPGCGIQLTSETKKKLNANYFCRPHYKDQMKALHLKELLDGEKEYVTDLEIATAYKNGLLEAGLITPYQAKILFPDLSSIEALHSGFAAKLETQWKQAEATSVFITDLPLGELFLVVANHLYIYTDYCANLPEQQKLRESLDENPNFIEFVPSVVASRIAAGVNRNMSLRSTLMKPMQRLCRYPLILKDILTHTSEGTPEYEKTLQAKDKASEIVAFVNSSITQGDSNKDLLSDDLFKPIAVKEKSEREKIINKIIATEQKYVKSLQLLLDVYPQDMLAEAQRKKIDLSEPEIKEMFLGVDTLLADHVKILVGMRQQVIGWDYETSMISGVLFRYGTFPIYSTIIPRIFKHLVVIDNCSCKEKPKLAKFLCKKMKEEKANGHSLVYFLNKIVTRPQKYLTQLKDLERATKESHPESGIIDGVMALITVVNKQCTDFIFSHRSAFKMEYLSSHLRYKEKKEWALNLRGRHYISEVAFTTRDSKKKSNGSTVKHTLYLFNDIVIAALETNVLWDIPLSTLLLELPPNTDQEVIMVDSSRPYMKHSILLDLTKKKMDKWIGSMNEAINKAAK